MGGLRSECGRKEVVFLFSLFASLATRFVGFFLTFLSLKVDLKKKNLFKEMRPFSGRGIYDEEIRLPSNFFLKWWRRGRGLDLSSGQIKRPDLLFTRRQRGLLSGGDSSPELRCCVQTLPFPLPGW